MTTKNLCRTLVATAFALVAFGEGSALADASCATVDRSNVVSCALAANHGVRADEHGVEAAQARYVAASPIFPSNPTLSLMGARRSTGDQVVPNWSVTLAQEIEIAGQRGKRRDQANEEIRSAQSRLVVSERDVAAVALRAWFDALASSSELDLAKRLETNAKAVATAARARADKGLVPTVEADVADAAALRATQARLDAEQHATDAKSALASLVGRAPSDGVTATGDLQPLPAPAVSAEARPEVAELDARRRAFEERASLLRRSRVPNVTVSGFVQNDALNDRLVGFGLSIPIPLPHPVGRTYAGEIAEAEAEAARAKSEAARITREIELRRALAASAYETSRTKLAAYTPDRVANAERQLGTIAQEVEAGRLAPRDAFVTEQALVDLLQAHVEAERSLCLASVELARASGAPLESR